MVLTPLPSPQQSLFWTAPKDVETEFVIEDPLAFDYLSQQVGSWLFGGLTTRTARAQYFAMVLYGLWLVDDGVSGRVVAASDADRKRLFERWERLWALATFESRDGGPFAQSDPDAVRGQRGVARAWRPGDGQLPLDYRLISRQSELGGLGAYLSTLRREDVALVFPGTLRPTSVAAPMIEAFWDEPGAGAKLGAYEEYARLALDEDRDKVPRKHGGITLARLGKLSRLSVLTERKRHDQQGRLWTAVFESARDDTLRFANILRDAHQAGIEEPREVLTEALAGRFGTIDQRQRDTLEIAVAYGDVQQALLTCFNRAFAEAIDGGWRVDVARAAGAAMGTGPGDALRAACARFLDLPGAARFRRLPMHGNEFVRLVMHLKDAPPPQALEAVLAYHAQIHRERRHGTPWLRVDAGRVVVDVGAYGERARAEGFFPPLKLHVVRSLLHDLGRLP